MRPGPARGEIASDTFIVTDDMAARVGDRVIHPVLGTPALVSQMEVVCRRLLEPHLEEDEDGVGYELRATHHKPAPVGAELTVTATVADVNSKRLLCEVAVRHGTQLVASGSFDQRVVAAEDFAERIDEAAPDPATA
jgi:fluoroacetyl-CoA thioesterase